LFVLFRQCGIVCFVQTVWYCLFCSDSVVLFVLFRQCGIVCFDVKNIKIKNIYQQSLSHKF
jgi:hypothetical protein